MAPNILDQLAALIDREREPLLLNWRQQVRHLPSARQCDVPTLNDHIPLLLEELAQAFRSNSSQTIPEALAESSPPVHGLQRLEEAFDIEEVVAEYNILRACIHDLADANDLRLQGRPFHILNRVLDHAIGLALETYATRQALDVQRRREEYLAFVAHDLRTPLSAISLSGRILERTAAGEGGDTLRILNALRRNVQHLETLVAKILEENANLETELGVKVQQREFDLWPLVEALIHDLHPVAGTDSTKLRNEVPDDMVIYADANLMRRVFQNLIGNAIRYTPRGAVTIGAKESPQNDCVECWVSDNGAGIPEPLLEAVFDKGETDPAIAGGTGLGLAIVKSFTEAHGGEVRVESRAGEGSTFRLWLPCRRAAL